MRWFCVAPDLPAKASLRVRTAPHSDADVCGRFSKGKAVAALSNIVEIADESGESECQRWLHVTFPEETSGEWIEGFVMTELANGMVLLVPWEDAGFNSCCNVTNDRAVVYEGPESTAQAVGLISEGEGTRFPYGVREVDGHRLRIFHDVHERVWVDAADVEFVCERLEHGKCTVPHSFFTLNEKLPPEAQIAVREFPSRDAETRALLSRGQVVEIEMRCGSWLKIAGFPESWMMWRTDTWQLLTELPFHSSGSCALVENDVDMDGGGEMQDEPMSQVGDLDATTPAGNDEVSVQLTESQDMEIDDGDSVALAIDQTAPAPHSNTSSDQGQETRTNPSSVTSLCNGLASHDTSHEEDTPAEELTAGRDAPHATQSSSDWDERPLNVKQFAQADRSDDDGGLQETPKDADAEIPIGMSSRSVSSSSWEDRPITKSTAGYNWESEYPPTPEAAVVNASDAVQQEPRQKILKSEDAESAEVDADEMADALVPAVNVEMVDAEEAAEQAGAVHSWEDRPITKSRGTYDWESEYPQPVEPVVDSVPDAASQESGHQAEKWKDVVETEVQAKEATGFDSSAADVVAEDVAETTEPAHSWVDRPITKSRGVYDWESECPLPEVTVDKDAPDSLPQDSSQQQVMGTGAASSAELTAGKTPDTSDPTIDVNMEVAEAEVVAEPIRAVHSWEDRPISKSRGIYNWESEYPPTAEAAFANASDSAPQESSQENAENEEAASADTDAADPSVSGINVEMEDAEKVVEQARAVHSWEDRPITKSSEAYNWESEYPLPVETSLVEEYGSNVDIQDGQARASAEPAGVLVPMEESGGMIIPHEEEKEWHWDEAPIKSRHARKAAGEFKSVHSQSGENSEKTEDDTKPWRVIRKQRGVKQSLPGLPVDEEQEPVSASTSSEGSPAVVGIDSSEDNPNRLNKDLAAATTASASNHSLNGARHTPPPAVAVVSGDVDSVAWFFNDIAEDPEVFDDGGGEVFRATSVEASDKSTELTREKESDVSDVSASIVIQAREVHTLDIGGDMAGDEQTPATAAHEASVMTFRSTIDNAPYHHQDDQPDSMNVEDDGPTNEESHVTVGDAHLSDYLSHIGDLNGRSEPFGDDHDPFPAVDEHLPSVHTGPHGYSARLVRITKSQSDASRIMKAIALDEGSDAILEALATTGEYDEEWLKYDYVPPGTRTQAVAPSPATSESALLDVLYSRDQEDGFATPEKRSPPPVSVPAQTIPYASESKEELLAGILRRTPQKATNSHSKIIHSANPDDILEAEFASGSDELGLFGNYRYPSSTSQFSSGLMMGSPMRTTAAFGSLPPPSFASSSFSSPPPKENPLKRSAAAIAKTPPVGHLPKSDAMSQPAMPSPASKPVVRALMFDPVPAQSSAKPAPVLTKTPTASRLPPSVRTPAALPRPSLVTPSRLRAPSTSGATANTAPAVSRARSFTASNNARPSNAPAASTASSTGAATSGFARTQSMLPRKSALQAPSPIKFGVARSNNLGTSATPPTTTTERGVDPRRLSFGFARPSSTSKKP